MKDNIIKTEIIVKGNNIGVMKVNDIDYISLTDLARYADSEEPRLPIRDWMRNKEIISYLGLWEKINNPNFKGGEFAPFENEAGSNKFKMSPQKWIKSINATLIRKNISQQERLIELNNIARNQLELFKHNKTIEELNLLESKN